MGPKLLHGLIAVDQWLKNAREARLDEFADAWAHTPKARLVNPERIAAETPPRRVLRPELEAILRPELDAETKLSGPPPVRNTATPDLILTCQITPPLGPGTNRESPLRD